MSAGTFGTITLADPGTGGSLTIRGGAGNDSISAAGITTFAAGLRVEGGDGTDSLALGSGTFANVAFAADIETVTADAATIADFVFDARPSSPTGHGFPPDRQDHHTTSRTSNHSITIKDPTSS